MKKKPKNWDVVFDYANAIRDGTKIACKDLKNAINRFFKDLKNKDYDFDPEGAEFVIRIIEKSFCHQQGESLDGTPLRGKPFLLEPFHKFIIYNLLGFKMKGTDIVRFHEALIYIPRKNIKALSLDTEIPTPNGWKLMKDIHVGDDVFGADGKTSKVLYESEIFNKPMYMVTFEDGAKVKASADHIWTVTCKDIESRKWSDFTTEYLSRHFKRIRPDGKGTEYRYRVPMNKPAEYPEKELPIHPYVFGLWLGDGTKDDTSITCCDGDKDEIMQYIQECNHTVKWYEHKNRAGAIGIDKTKRGGTKINGPPKNKTRDHLRDLGVYNNKHIPEIYMQSSVEQRWELLKGLMDTDGTVSKKGQCSFSQKNENLIKQVKELCASLGIKANYRKINVSCNGKICEAFHLTFFVDKENSCFKLQRKHERLKDKLNKRMEAKSIIDIQPIPNEPSKCIMIDNDTHLYLCGRNYTATHNTSYSAALAWALALWYRESGSKIYITSAGLMQSLESFNFIQYNVKRMGEWDKDGGHFRIIDNNNEHSISGTVGDGSINIRALAADPDRQDSLNCNIAIADRLLSLIPVMV